MMTRPSTRQPGSSRSAGTGLRLAVGVMLLGVFSSHAITGLLWSIGWFDLIGVDYQAWYLRPGYLTFSWIATIGGVCIVAPMFMGALRRSDDGHAEREKLSAGQDSNAR